MLEHFAGERFGELALILGYSGPSLARFEKDAERIKERLGELEELGVDWTIVSPPWTPAPGPLEWLEAFAATFITS